MKILLLLAAIVFILPFSGLDRERAQASSLLNADKPLTQRWGIYISPSKSKKFIDEQINLASKIGFKFARIPVDQLPFGKKYQQKTSLVEYAIKKAKASKLTPIVNFTGGTPGNFGGNPQIYDPLVSEIKQNIAQFIRSNSDRGIIWETWNEPNGTFWSTNTTQDKNSQAFIDEWLTMNNFIVETVRKNDANSIVINGDFVGLPTTVENLINQVKQSPGGKASSALSFHPYLDAGQNNGRPEQLINQLKSHKTMPYVVTEFGYAIDSVVSKYNENAIGVWTKQQQAAYLVRASLIFDMNNVPFFTLYNMSNEQDHYGIEYHGKLNPAGQALMYLGKQLKDYHFKGVIKTNDKTIMALRYQKKQHIDKLVYWSTDDETKSGKANVDGHKMNITAKRMPQVTEIISWYTLASWILAFIGLIIFSILGILFYKRKRR